MKEKKTSDQSGCRYCEDDSHYPSYFRNNGIC